MTRLPNWQSRLQSFLNQHRDDKFSYGTWDCALFVCDAIQCMTGVDPAEWFRGRYHSRAAAMDAVNEFCGSKSLRVLVARVTMERSMQQVEPGFAGRGDVVLLRRGRRGTSLGIVSLNGSSIEVITPKGLQQCPRDLAIQAWRV